MYKDLLPIGSVVLLKGGEKRLMVCGRVVCSGDSEEIHDYVGCYYPEGVVDYSELFFFEQDAIEDIFFIGFQDREEIQYRGGVLGELDKHELIVKDGQIVIKEE